MRFRFDFNASLLTVFAISVHIVMKIAQVAPLWERVPFRYGGIELIVCLLTDELVRRGHDVTLFASGDSITTAKLKSVHDQALRLDPSIREPGLYEQMMLVDIYQQAHHFDIIHCTLAVQLFRIQVLLKRQRCIQCTASSHQITRRCSENLPGNHTSALARRKENLA
jgi:glycosyltransferase involved in cell wall biosynthesis